MLRKRRIDQRSHGAGESVELVEEFGASNLPNVLVDNFLMPETGKSLDECLRCPIAQREEVEAFGVKRLADELAHRMSWDKLVAERIAPALNRLWTL